ncbi:MAG TPA: hypothetical protein HPP97_06830 [Desulfuromonadales bacterium]|nr:hypothetical protein [Desulfuromonadales bacterium]
MKARFLLLLLLTPAALPAHAFNCGPDRMLVSELRTDHDNMEREIHGYKNEMADIKEELSRYESETDRMIEEIQEKIRKKWYDVEDSISERQKMMEEYKRMKLELEQGLYCSKCGKSKTQIERSGRESFSEHVKNVRSKIERAPANVIRNLYEESRRNWKISYDKTSKLEREEEALEREIKKLEIDRAKQREELSARLLRLDDITHKRALDYPPLLGRISEAERRARKNNCL